MYFFATKIVVIAHAQKTELWALSPNTVVHSSNIRSWPAFFMKMYEFEYPTVNTLHEVERFCMM